MDLSHRERTDDLVLANSRMSFHLEAEPHSLQQCCNHVRLLGRKDVWLESSYDACVEDGGGSPPSGDLSTCSAVEDWLDLSHSDPIGDVKDFATPCWRAIAVVDGDDLVGQVLQFAA
eukprot:CAMPEP_0170588080 /NCGR_PEP_ID=MMETSP0224-20130122/10636_1 /TAXON_ID=285029 /ORGANISM="Togula jolla, Strain CCCM 725" /LENGTH=116 /DNA_ID=CAMNT_0010911767 /DNA_START=234 /DNA_END=585 /DNA_ORIENTATION=-